MLELAESTVANHSLKQLPCAGVITDASQAVTEETTLEPLVSSGPVASKRGVSQMVEQELAGLRGSLLPKLRRKPDPGCRIQDALAQPKGAGILIA
jgi:hypothetical protein